MQQIQLPDAVYQEAARRAQEAGMTVDAYVAELVQTTGNVDPMENLEARFTPEVLEHLDEVAAEVRAGKFRTAEEVDARHAERRAAWLNRDV